MMKKLLSLIAVLCQLVSCVPALADPAAAPAIVLKPYSVDDGYTYVEYG